MQKYEQDWNTLYEKERKNFNPAPVADDIVAILKSERPAETCFTTIDIRIDIGMNTNATLEIYFLGSQKEELGFYEKSLLSASKTQFQRRIGELDIWQINRLLNSISVRVNQTPKQTYPRKTCVTAHWEW